MEGYAHVTRKQEHDWDHLFIHSIVVYIYIYIYIFIYFHIFLHGWKDDCSELRKKTHRHVRERAMSGPLPEAP